MYFVILTAGRSGSTLLGNALQGHPHLLSFGELLDIPSPPEPLWLKDKTVAVRQIRQAEPWHEYLQNVVLRPHGSPYKSVGCRIKYYHLNKTSDLLDYLCSSGVRLIHSRRRNIITQGLSLPLAHAHEFEDMRSDPSRKGQYSTSVNVDIHQFLAWCECVTESAARIERLFTPRTPVLDVYYGDLCQTDENGVLTMQGSVDRVLQFLGVESRVLTTEMLKQRVTPYTQLIRNYDELRRESLRVHPEWKSHFDEMESAAMLV